MGQLISFVSPPGNKLLLTFSAKNDQDSQTVSSYRIFPPYQKYISRSSVWWMGWWRYSDLEMSTFSAFHDYKAPFKVLTVASDEGTGFMNEEARLLVQWSRSRDAVIHSYVLATLNPSRATSPRPILIADPTSCRILVRSMRSVRLMPICFHMGTL